MAPSALPRRGADCLHFEFGALVDHDDAVWVHLVDDAALRLDEWLTAHETADRTLLRLERVADRFRFVFRVRTPPPPSSGSAR